LAYLGLLSHYLGDNEAAHEYSQQALFIAQELGNRYIQGYALTNLGHALVGLGRLDEAAHAYQQALALRRELGQHHLAMEPLAGLARVSLAQGNLSQAQAQVEEVLGHLETHTPSTGPSATSGHGLEGTDEPFRVYLTCYRVLRANQDPRAQAILNTGYSLLQEQATKISDEELRRSFLENVAAHREIVEEMRTLKRLV
ncbi:MAG: tetratricopeptide repeat protein, partial [Anaerolineae bacterium]|nr:tetratricopeptide repeat protein [Anaerolineae bacterium]